MKLISYDIGIRNMAYCIFEIVSEQLIIRDWNVINLAITHNSEPDTPHRCSCSKKMTKKQEINGNVVVCTKIAKYEKNGTFFCEKHATTIGQNLGHIIPTKSISTPSLKKLSIDELITLGNKYRCTNITECKTKKSLLDRLQTFFSDNCFIPIISKKQIAASEIDLITIGRNMRTELDKLKEVSKDTTHIIMENQISPLAGRMKTVQGMLAQYYIMTSDQEHPVEILFVSSANKLKGLVKETTNETSSYKKHKSDSIDICTRFLAENPSITSWSISSKSKKDDYADCFLQGIWYLKQSKIITYADNLKINLV